IDVCETDSNYGGANNHRDPGLHWEWCQYFEKLGGSCTCADAWNFWNCTTDKTEAVRCNNNQVEIQHCAQGCVSQPVGTDDVCNGATSGSGGAGGSGGTGGSAGGDTGSGGSGGSTGTGGAGDNPGGSGGGNSPTTSSMEGGCSAAPGASTSSGVL